MDATARLVAIIVLTSFATERILAAIAYFLDLRNPEKKNLREKAPRKFFLLALAAVITGVVVERADIRILRLVTPDVSDVLDLLVTWLVVFAGADQIRGLLQVPEAAPESKNETPKDAAVVIRIDGDGNIIREK